jgi:HEPN domain-containing protein
MADSTDVARELLALAGDDEAAARAMLPVGSVTDAIVGFHAQQAVEKSLKAVLASRGIAYMFTHDLGYLSDLCKASQIGLPSALDGIKQLTPFATTGRYGEGPPGNIDRDQALAWAAAAVAWAQTLIQAAAGTEQEPSLPAD